MKEEPSKHIGELEAVLEASQSLSSLLEFWAFRAAYHEVSFNMTYLKRQRTDENAEQADEMISSLEKLSIKYDGILVNKHYYELDNH